MIDKAAESVLFSDLVKLFLCTGGIKVLVVSIHLLKQLFGRIGRLLLSRQTGFLKVGAGLLIDAHFV